MTATKTATKTAETFHSRIDECVSCIGVRRVGLPSLEGQGCSVTASCAFSHELIAPSYSDLKGAQQTKRGIYATSPPLFREHRVGTFGEASEQYAASTVQPILLYSYQLAYKPDDAEDVRGFSPDMDRWDVSGRFVCYGGTLEDDGTVTPFLWVAGAEVIEEAYGKEGAPVKEPDDTVRNDCSGARDDLDKWLTNPRAQREGYIAACQSAAEQATARALQIEKDAALWHQLARDIRQIRA